MSTRVRGACAGRPENSASPLGAASSSSGRSYTAVVMNPHLVSNPVDARPPGSRAESAFLAQSPFHQGYLTLSQSMDALGLLKVDGQSAISDVVSGKF